MEFPPELQLDGYKLGHPQQHVPGFNLGYSNLTPRGTRRPNNGVGGVISFGQQYFIKEYLIRQWNENFFAINRQKVVDRFHRFAKAYVGLERTEHIEALHNLGYLPLLIKAIPEGTLVPYRVPVMTSRSTHDFFGWLPNSLETILSNVLFMGMTSATTAFQYRRAFKKYAELTGTHPDFVGWQGHDFSMRGMPGVEAAVTSGAGHLLSFTGTDTCPAMLFLEQYYGANIETELVGGSVNATEHAVMCEDGREGEVETYRRLLQDVYPTGILSIVSDTYNFWDVLTVLLPSLRDLVEKRDGKLVIRPDSGDPVKIILGDPDSTDERAKLGAVRLLWKLFGGKMNEKGFIDPMPYLGLIYGDSITLERQEAILSGLQKMGFSTAWIVLGIGSYTYQHVTRDTDGFAMKATYAEVNHIGRAIFKKPATDNGEKNSAKGLLRVDKVDGKLVLTEDCSWEDEDGGVLRPVFYNGSLLNEQSLSQIRARVMEQL